MIMQVHDELVFEIKEDRLNRYTDHYQNYHVLGRRFECAIDSGYRCR